MPRIEKHHQAYCRIFDRCGLEYIVVEAHSGAMGGSQSHEFMVASDAGEDFVALCNKMRVRGEPGESGFESGRRRLVPDPEGDLAPKSFTRPAARRSPT